MPDLPDEPQNPIVALAQSIRARREIDAAVAPADASGGPPALDPEGELERFGRALADGCKRLNAILGRDGVLFVRLERPLRLRLRFREQRVSLDLDRERQLVVVRGLGLDGDYQFDPDAAIPVLRNLSALSTDAAYREPLSASALVRRIARDAELPPPAFDGSGPLQL
ncbi:MAG: hypothetical protein ACREM2_04130 [Vulcanimicrobiaceae bacterium]